MGKCRTPTFIAEFQLRTTPADERALRIRLDAGRNIYNAALGEALRRLDLMRESRAYQAASKLPRGNKTTPEGKALKRARDDAFNAIRAHHQFDKASIVKFTTACRNNCWIKDHLGSQEAQATARRAFDVVNRHAFSGRNPDTKGNAKTGKKARKGRLKFGRPRFRGKRFFHSVENQSIKQGLRFKDGILQWGELRLPIRRDPHASKRLLPSLIA
jgi:putative transposase